MKIMKILKFINLKINNIKWNLDDYNLLRNWVEKLKAN